MQDEAARNGLAHTTGYYNPSAASAAGFGS